MTTPDQNHFRGFIFRRLRPFTRAIALAQCHAVILAAMTANAQTTLTATVNGGNTW